MEPDARTQPRRPNILLLVSDQERQRRWLPPSVSLPHRERLLREGLEFERYYTHSSPCSPSRASLFTGLNVPQHGIRENVIFFDQPALSQKVRTLGHRLRGAGYRTAYLGKWHLQHGATPDLEGYGFGDWTGNDLHYMGWAGTGAQFDPVIADQAEQWLAREAPGETRPWFLVVALVNPHDVMWFPADQQDYQTKNADQVEQFKAVLRFAGWKEGDPIPPYDRPYPRIFDQLPPNFADDLSTKPAVHSAWRDEQQGSFWGRIDPADRDSWLRHLDYYAELHRRGDENLGRILAALDASGQASHTAVAFTADHGDMCGSHGLRSKGPFLYEEVMNVPLYVRVPGVTRAGTRTRALGSHVDLARTLVRLGGGDDAGMAGADLSGVFADPQSAARDHVLFCQEQSWYENCIPLRWASRGIFDGRYKYARYFGVGGGYTQFGQASDEPMRVTASADFSEFEHELYDLQEDPHELVNLARDPGKSARVRALFDRLCEEEARQYAAAPDAVTK